MLTWSKSLPVFTSGSVLGHSFSDPEGKRVVFVNINACMASQIVTLKVIERLKARYGDLYTEKNVGISGIHTHAGPGGYLQYVVYIVTSLGFVRQSFEALVNGIENSIIQAHENLSPGSIFINKGTIEDVDDMCKEDDVGKTTSASGVGSSRSESSSVPL
ncbi:neutral ceramidase 1 [Brassica rapa]|nr:neutral ceramidase 1 [Brassica rapa]XP_013691424.1 neutral ceramidase 1 [Brassica napus]XP_033137672.1 neutral ceramidase 1 [Brassica rapa]